MACARPTGATVAPGACAATPPALPAVREARRERRLATAFAALGLVVFGVAIALDPYDSAGRPRTHGTHRQLGLPACSLRVFPGVACPTCGMTTAFSLLAHGDPAAAWRTNWAGVVVAAVAVLGTGWFLLVALGLPPGRMTADAVLGWMVAAGAGAALLRWIAVVGRAAAFAVLVAAASACRASDGAPEPVRVTVGAYVNSVPSVDLAGNTFKFDAYIWFRWDPQAWPPRLPGAPAAAAAPEAEAAGAAEAEGDGPVLAGPATTFEVIGIDGELARIPLYSRPGYCCVQIKAVRHSLWDVRDFPFDRQLLSIVIEDGSYDERQLLYEPDLKGARVHPELAVVGFRRLPFEQKVTSYVYDTTFGDPDLPLEGASPYSRYTFAIPMCRESTGLFFKLFSGLLVSTTIAMIALFINATQVDPRFGLCVGALFGIIGSSYLVSSLLPQTSELCYADNLHNAALITVLTVVVESAASLALHLNRGEAGAAVARRMDRITFAVLAIGFLAIVGWLTLRAVGGTA